MRTTITLAPDVAAAVRRLREERQVGVSEAVNDLVRAGLARGDSEARPFVQDTSPMGLRIDVADIAKALDLLDGPDVP